MSVFWRRTAFCSRKMRAYLLKKYNVKTCHCPLSNCGKGIPDTPALLQRGITVGLGTDGAAMGGLSLWNEMKIFRSVMNVGRGVGISEAGGRYASSENHPHGDTGRI